MNINNLSFQNDKIKDINSFLSSPNKSQIFLTIHLEKGETENLNISKNTNPEELAYNFCLKHNLDFTSVRELITKIKNFKRRNLIAEKENLGISSNIKNNKSALPLGNYIININNNNKKSLINYSSNTINLKEFDNHKKNKDNNCKNNIFSNSNITPINSGSNNSKNNLAYTSSEKNLNIFDFGNSKEENDDKLTNNNNNSNINFLNVSNKNKYEYNKKSYDTISNNSKYLYNFNESINNKINNLEKAYANFNPNNKKSDSKKGNSKNEIRDTAKEIISQTIKNCLKSLEKEEIIDNNVTISENNNYPLKQENKTISVENNPESEQNKSNFIEENDNVFSLKNIYLIPKEKKISLFNNENLDKDSKIDIDIINPRINNINQEKNPFQPININNEIREDEKIYFNKNFYKNKEENITHEEEIKINNLEENNNLMKIPTNNIKNIKNTFNMNNLNKYLNRNNNLNLNNNNYISNYNMTQYNKDIDINIKTIDNNIIQKEIKFSLLSNKKNIPLSYSHKGFKMKKFRKVLKKNLINYRSFHEQKKNNDSIKNNNSIKSNYNNSFNNNINKDSLISDNNIKNNRNTSSLKIIINTNNNDKNDFNSLKEDKSFNKSYPLSYTRSEKSMNKDSLKNKNNKNKDYYNIRTTTTSLGNRTNYYSSISRGSTNKKKCQNKKLINSNNNFNKIPFNHIFNYSNEFLIKKQKDKENNNTYYNNTTTVINNSQNLLYTNFSYNNKRKIYNSPDYLSQRTKSNIAVDYKNNSKIKLIKKNKNFHPNLNNLSRNLMLKKEIINSLNNIFNCITKNNRTLDAFAIVNKQIIPNDIYNIIKKIVNHCDKSKRFIEYNEFINKAIDIFELFSMNEKITILNFNQNNS